MTVLMVAIGAALGAPARYLTDRAVQQRHETLFPWGTFLVNLVGSFLLGLLTAAATGGLDPRVLALAGTGFCGALTTFSTFGYETVRLVEDGSLLEAAGNVVVSVAVGLGA
ncbi:MAG: fluoride efflux transporter CrcB, partial [Motilibacteraceae bacterium]